MATKVRDELSGREYEAAEVVWILGTNGGFTKRDRTIPHATARLHALMPEFPGSRPWAPTISRDAWTPVEVLP